MATIEYSGFAPSEARLINSEDFLAVLAKHPELRLVTVDEDDNGEELFIDVLLPLSESHDNYVAVVDNNDGFMWVLYDDYCEISDPNDAFIDVLTVMDKVSVELFGERLFVAGDWDLVVDDEPVLSAEYDFSVGDYAL